MNTKRVATIPVERNQSGVDDAAEPETGYLHEPPKTLGTKLRQETVAEIEAMGLFLLSDGHHIGQDAADALSRLEQREMMSLGELIQLHGHLATAVAPAKPRSILSIRQGQSAGRWGSFLGPTPGVRRLTSSSLFFALAFLIISLSNDVNVEAMSLSIYELDGVPAAIKLALIVSAAGLGASFAALFRVWEDLRSHRYDPLAESASWMQVGLGLVAGLILSEIIGGEGALVADADGAVSLNGFSEPLLALLGGFSAGVIHMVLNSIVNALRRAFGEDPHGRDPRALPQQTPAQNRIVEDITSNQTPRQPETQPITNPSQRNPQDEKPRNEPQ